MHLWRTPDAWSRGWAAREDVSYSDGLFVRQVKRRNLFKRGLVGAVIHIHGRAAFAFCQCERIWEIPFLQLLVEKDKSAHGKVQEQDVVFSFLPGFVEWEIKPFMKIGYWFPKVSCIPGMCVEVLLSFANHIQIEFNAVKVQNRLK